MLNKQEHRYNEDRHERQSKNSVLDGAGHGMIASEKGERACLQKK